MTALARRVGLRPDGIHAAYARLARGYDAVFGPLLAPARNAAIRAVNALPGAEVLEVGVGTGLALPNYAPCKRITGIDVSAAMLARARAKVARLQLTQIRALHEMDAQETGFPDAAFDIAVAMFVASVVPDPRALLAEMRRVVKPGGTLLFVNHFARDGKPEWWGKCADMLTAKLGWRADFHMADLFDDVALRAISAQPQAPFGMFQLVALPR